MSLGRASVRILGGGLSGLTAAIVLAQAGRQVDVFEARDDCGARFHGDFQGLENWSGDEPFLAQAAAWGIDVGGFEAAPVHAVDVVLADRSVLRVTSRTPAVHLVRRGTAEGTLDQALKRQALELGARLHFGARPPRASCDIVATGPDRATGYVHGELFETEAPDRVALLFESAAAPGGYGYLIVSRGRGLIATVVLRRGAHADRCLEATLDVFRHTHPEVRRRSPRRFGGIGRFALQRRYAWGGQLFIGEAAGLQDALWGFGIRHAMTSGRLAALSVVGGEAYEPALARGVLPQVRASLVSRWLVDGCGDRFVQGLLRAWSVEQRVRGDGLAFPARLYRSDPLRRLLFPLASTRLVPDARAALEARARWLPFGAGEA